MFVLRDERGVIPTSLIIFPPRWMVLLLTISTMATPKLQRIPKEMQNPSPLMMAMMYLRGSPKQVQSHIGAFFSGASRGFPSSVSSMLSPGFCFFSRTLPNTRGKDKQETWSQLSRKGHLNGKVTMDRRRDFLFQITFSCSLATTRGIHNYSSPPKQGGAADENCSSLIKNLGLNMLEALRRAATTAEAPCCLVQRGLLGTEKLSWRFNFLVIAL